MEFLVLSKCSDEAFAMAQVGSAYYAIAKQLLISFEDCNQCSLILFSKVVNLQAIAIYFITIYLLYYFIIFKNKHYV